MAKCEICGMPKEDDLFSAITNEPVCSICKVKYIRGLPTTTERINDVREKLSIPDGEYLNQNNAEEAAKILGR